MDNIGKFSKSIEMRRISSKMTFINKRIYPLFVLGFLGFLIITESYSAIVKGSGPPFPLFILPVFMAVFAYLFKKVISDLVDKVYDGGDFLLVKDKKREDRIPLSNILNVSYSILMKPERVTISLREPSIFGKEVSFLPPQRFTFMFNYRSPLIEELINRVENARNS